MLRNCYESVKLEATNYLTEDVNYDIIKVHQGEGRNIIYTRRSHIEGAGSWKAAMGAGPWELLQQLGAGLSSI